MHMFVQTKLISTKIINIKLKLRYEIKVMKCYLLHILHSVIFYLILYDKNVPVIRNEALDFIFY